MQPKVIPLKQEMTLLHLPQMPSRTDRLTAVLSVPLREETAAQYAALPGLLTRRCHRYPTVTALGQRQDQLYGASVQGQAIRLGEWQMMKFSVSFLQENYTLHKEDLTADCTRLLLELLFDPLLENGLFRQTDLAQEQRCLLERLEGEINNKRLYARKQCEKLLCPDQPYSVDPNGTPETVRALTPVSVTAAWQTLLSTARIHWIYQGSGDTSALASAIEDCFATLPPRCPVHLTPDTTFTMKESARTDEMPIKQTKLVLGLRIAAAEPDGQVNAARLMNTLLGGCASSMLFKHVREEQSLCYYCASTYDRLQGIMLIDSGVEAVNAERTREEILRQLEALRQGQFSDDELEAARRSLIQGFTAIDETPADRESWYAGQTPYDRYTTPEETANQLLAITRDDVCRVARLVHLDTTYLLKPATEEVHA